MADAEDLRSSAARRVGSTPSPGTKIMKNIFIIIMAAILLLIGGIWWSNSSQSSDPNIVSTQGIHWHSQLTIYVDGKKQDIPANIGVGPQYDSMPTFDSGMRMTAMHTHEPDGTIHLEFPDRVTKNDIVLGNFFRIWGKDFLEFRPSIHMTVNNEGNTELQNYIMKDGDKIELRYE